MKRIFLIFSALMLCSAAAFAASEEVVIECPWGGIAATLATPECGADVAVLIVAGSGPTDRNGNSGLNLNSYAYKRLSEALVEAGYAVLRYDKRAIGGSAIPAEEVPNLLFGDYVEDAERCVAWLYERGFTRVFMAGHSEGGTIALEVAARDRVTLSGAVLLAAPGYPMDQILVSQLAAQLIPSHIGLFVAAQSIIAKIKEGVEVTAEDIPAELISLFHPTVQPFLRSSMQSDPAQLIARCDEPMLIITGGRDIQVSVDNGQRLQSAARDARHVTFANMSHVLKDAASSDRMEQVVSVYTNSQLPLTEGLVPAIVEFLNNVTK